MIVQELYKIQNRHGYLPRGELEGLAHRLATPLYRIEEVVSFFPHFTKTPPPGMQVQVCIDMACHLRGAEPLIEELKGHAETISAERTKKAEDEHGKLTDLQRAAAQVKVCGVSCLGRCDRAVAVRVFDNRPALLNHSSENGHAHDHAHEPHSLLNRSKEDIVAVMKGDMSLKNDKDADLPDESSSWKINELYQGKPRSEWYASIKRFVSEQKKIAESPPEPKPAPRAEARPADPTQPTVAELARAKPDVTNAAEKAVLDEALKPEEKKETPKPEAKREAPPVPEMDRERKRIINAMEVASLLGMGGAGGRAAKKWSDVYNATGTPTVSNTETNAGTTAGNNPGTVPIKYVVCNGDESEPGTFKDREILLRTPHLLVEAMTLAGLFLKAERGYIYIRHEFEEQIAACRAEIEWAKSQKLLGNNILGSGQSFELEVFVSPGGYICGEQTALIQAIQDERAEPRNRPPELQTNGLWDKPTLVNNVETFTWVPSIVERGEGEWFAKQARKAPDKPLNKRAEGFRGARFFSVSGDVNRPRAVEVPIGITIGELIEACGGMKDGRKLLAIALSGPSGGFTPAVLDYEKSFKSPEAQKRVPPGKKEIDIRDLELDIQFFRDIRIMMGAGIIVYAEGSNLVDQAVACLKFYQRESCGKCVPCRIGSTKMTEWGIKIQAGQSSQAEIKEFQKADGPLQDLATVMRSTAICGLGNVAPNPLTSLLRYFPDQIAPYLKS